jgi:hypothetical protein
MVETSKNHIRLLAACCCVVLQENAMAGCVHPEALRPCKKGPCDKCESLCKRCGCSCDGLTPEEKLRRTVGGSAKKDKRVRTETDNENEERPRRKAKTTAIAGVSNSVTHDLEREDAHEQPQAEKGINLDTLWKFFGFSQSRRKKIPSESNRESMSAESISRESWSVLVNCVVDAARTVARYLFPSDHELLLQSAARKLVNNVDEETRSHAKLEKAANSIAAVYMAAPKGSLQRRTARAFLVKSFPKEMIDSVVGIPNKSRQKSYEDYNKMEDGELLDVSRGGKARFNKETTEACVSLTSRKQRNARATMALLMMRMWMVTRTSTMDSLPMMYMLSAAIRAVKW